MIKSILNILTGSGLAVAIGVISLPLLTRLYSPESFGALQLFQTITLYCIVYSSFRYEVTLLTIDADEIESMTLLCFILTGIAFLITSIVLLIFILVAGGKSYFDVLVWLPAAVLVASFAQIFTYLGQRYQKYLIISKSKVIQASANSASCVVAGALGFETGGLIFSDLLGRVAYFVYLIKSLPRNFSVVVKFNIDRFYGLMIKYKSLPLFAVPGGFINVAGGTLTSVMMFTVFNPAIAGQYFLAEKVVILPFALVAAAVSHVFSSEFASLMRSEKAKCRGLFWGIVIKMGLVGIIPCFLIFFFSEQIFSNLFGDEWLTAALMAKYMSFLTLTNLMVTPVNMTIMIIGNQGIQLFWEIVRLAVMASAWYLLSVEKVEPIMAVQVHVFCSIMIAIFFVYLADNQIKSLIKN